MDCNGDRYMYETNINDSQGYDNFSDGNYDDYNSLTFGQTQTTTTNYGNIDTRMIPSFYTQNLLNKFNYFSMADHGQPNQELGIDYNFLWIRPQAFIMLTDQHNKFCRSHKLFNYSLFLPSLEDKSQNRVRLKFRRSDSLSSCTLMKLFQEYLKRLHDCMTFIPFNPDFYYWEYNFRLNPSSSILNRMLLPDDMWLTPTCIPTAFYSPNAPLRPFIFTQPKSLGVISCTSPQFPRKVLACDDKNSDEVTYINDETKTTGVQKRYFVLKLVDNLLSLVIDLHIKFRVTSEQLRYHLKPEFMKEDINQDVEKLSKIIYDSTKYMPIMLNYHDSLNAFIRAYQYSTDINIQKLIIFGILTSLLSNELNEESFNRITCSSELIRFILSNLYIHVTSPEMMFLLEKYTIFKDHKLYKTFIFWKIVHVLHIFIIKSVPGILAMDFLSMVFDVTLKSIQFLNKEKEEASVEIQSRNLVIRELKNLFTEQYEISLFRKNEDLHNQGKYIIHCFRQYFKE